MTDTQIVSNPVIWPTIANDEQRRTDLFDWLRANSIEPNDIPIDSTVSIEPGDCGSAVRHTHVIRHAVYLRNEHGHHYLADPDHPEKGAAREERALPLVVPLPDTWPQPVQRAEHPDTPATCKRCKGTRKVPDWANWNQAYGEPYPKPCPDCTPSAATTEES